MINLSRVVNSMLLNVQQLLVYRSSGSYVAGRWVEAAPPALATPLTIYGVTHPSTDREIDMLPEGDRIKEAITFLTVEEIYTTGGTNELDGSGTPRISDKIKWNGDLYRVRLVSQYKDYGYFMSVATRMAGD